MFSGRLWLRLINRINTPEIPSKIPETKDMNESTVDMAATPPATYKTGKLS